MKYICLIIILFSHSVTAQKVSEIEATSARLRTAIAFLSDDKLEGRRTGSPGEKLAYEFIVKEFTKAGLTPFGNLKNYLQPFNVNDGKEIGKETSFSRAGKPQELHAAFFPFPFSGNVKNMAVRESDIAWYEARNVISENANNPHFDIKQNIIDFSKKASAAGKKLVIVREPGERSSMVIRPDRVNNDGKVEKLTATANTKSSSAGENLFLFDTKDRTATLNIPVIYFKEPQPEQTGETAVAIETSDEEKPSNEEILSTVTVNLVSKVRTGHNVIGYINNKATNTIVLGAHYDHLGYGEDHNTLDPSAGRVIHNGADDNASGTAALIELGSRLKRSALKQYNYVLVAFSGEELGLFGSKYFTENSGLDPKKINYMINMDMIGRLNDSTHGLTIGGYGTSPSWGKLIKTNDAYFKINVDSSGSGPSDHTSFYRKDIPVLFFFTGSHKDYHKAGDDAEKINYNGELRIIDYIENLIKQTNNLEKLSFTKTREVSMGKGSFKVSMGIMPDYTFSGSGVLVEGVSENKAAQKAGVKTGDVLIQLGEHKFTDVQTYMDVLNKFNKGESTNVKLKRGKEELILPVTF